MARSAPSDAYEGRIVAQKYRVEALIGEGGMGKVYRARQFALDKPVVLKVLRQSLMSDERTVARFQREARAASRLNHPNSINVLDFGQAEDGAFFIAMEFVSGKDLHQVLSTEWPLPEARIVRIVAQVLSALGDAHIAGVIHRDLKPENIMVEQRRNAPDFVKVLDFGIAKIQEAGDSDGPALTRAGFVCGTPEYMSPEQARGATLDARSDLYAVGVILYQLVTGLLPFDSDSAVGFATKHLTEVPPPPSQRRPGVRVSTGLEQLILRALAKDPELRPQSAEAFREELRALQQEAVGTPAPRPLLLTTPAPPTAPQAASFASTRPVALRAPEPAPRPATAAGGRSLLGFKVLTGALVVAALAVAGYALQGWVRPPAPAAVAPAAEVAAAGPAAAGEPLYALEVPLDARDPARAQQLAQAGDTAHEHGQLDVAAQRYREAFRLDPDPELALKLGELAWQRDATAEARGWWQRHLRDASDSHARRYIEQAMSDVSAEPQASPTGP
nr:MULTISPECIES: serine/threonine-protein kinase [Myxococcaceae]